MSGDLSVGGGGGKLQTAVVRYEKRFPWSLIHPFLRVSPAWWMSSLLLRAACFRFDCCRIEYLFRISLELFKFDYYFHDS
ncbi:unnamed protein product [Triticum turgidum subsp. durum]|uniref:Uncharacterized protein n=1 Tax=Triticum turgidum subsp. durum TaxID=4567 RepID=A0A9R1BNH3_TRITD|nr:unnamed protein product [Triticum turgidum subsp. durum]